MNAWCDTPEYGNDHLQVLISTGGLFVQTSYIDERTLYYYTDTWYSTWIDGHEGYYGNIAIASGQFGPDTAIRIRWISDSEDDTSYGCAVKSITF
jgi:hypothetical protein